MSMTTILNKQNVEVMWQIRKLVRQEFGFELKISDQDVETRLKRCEGETGNSELKQLIQKITRQLEQYSPTVSRSDNNSDQPADQPEVNRARYYRGQRVEAPASPSTQHSESDDSTPSSRQKRVCRGQVIG